MDEIIVAKHATHQHTLVLEFNRPGKKNALNAKMYQALNTALNEAKEDDNILCVLFKGQPGCFTSGNDVTDFIQKNQEAMSAVIEFIKTLANFPKPLVASVEGLAVGIGTTLLLHCDFVYATKDAVFALPFVQLGLCPEAGSSVLLPIRIGTLKSNEMLFLGKKMGGQEAQNSQLINQCFDDNKQLSENLDILLRQLGRCPPNATKITKALLKASGLEDKDWLNKVIDAECKAFASCLMGSEAKTALAMAIG